MRKLHIINLEKMGGVERLFLQYIRHESAQNDAIFCISNQVGPEIAQYLTDKKITFVNRIFNALALKFPSFLRKYALQFKTWRARPDAIIVWDLVPVFAHAPSRGKVIYYDHGCSWRYPHNQKTLAFFAMLSGCISAAHASKRVMELRFQLPCPVNVVINRILPPPDINSGEKAPRTPLRLGVAARLVGLKGISVALLAVKTLRERNVDVELEIAGKGPDEENFKALAVKLGIADCVTFLGFQSNLSSFFNRIHIYLSTPVTEPFGLSCMEALFYGVPVVFPLIDGQPEVVRDGYCGLGIIPTVSPETHFGLSGVNVNFPYHVYSPTQDTLVPPMLMSHEACADAIQTIAGDDYQTFRNNAFEHVRRNFDYRNFVGDFNNAIIGIVND
ncbi:glycosyltransferase [Enterobacillus tribolii]|uniref:Glycosyltransferase involved in cell wall biosynthesis n=1 Tax=Enterobacillus tribolii TaxID=1487935 RepID=A0A370QUD8_9GAMM|nr:glycosyltransferase [Enterobacillus tribolii]MBW7981071.1 glycosyltransferase [Enterobacillus tribolii]RDK92872.1 glycosyltransferase involved in cell wall biosynthesis [Enterobacillus tribolii]